MAELIVKFIKCLLSGTSEIISFENVSELDLPMKACYFGTWILTIGVGIMSILIFYMAIIRFAPHVSSLRTVIFIGWDCVTAALIFSFLMFWFAGGVPDAINLLRSTFLLFITVVLISAVKVDLRSAT